MNIQPRGTTIWLAGAALVAIALFACFGNLSRWTVARVDPHKHRRAANFQPQPPGEPAQLPGEPAAVGMNLRADDGTAVPPAVAAALQAVVKEKSVALKNATVSVNRAYNYTGPTTTVPRKSAKRIAVDATFSGCTDRFKIWDVDIIDGKTDDNFGSEPDVAFLNDKGEFLSFEGDDVDFTKPIRLLMIYAVPDSTSSIKLGYWGDEQTKIAIPLEEQGPALPDRK
jgi:hypothetical protein